MRRWLRGAVVGLLTFSLSFDTANACWFARRCRPAPVCRPLVCQPCCVEPPWSVEIVCGAPVSGARPCCGHEVAEAASGGMAIDAAPAGESVIATPADATPPQIAAEEAIESRSQTAATPAAPQPAIPEASLPEARLPQLQAVEPAAAVAAEPAAPAVTPAVALDATRAQPAEPAEPAAEPGVPAAEPATMDVSAEDIIQAAKQGAGASMPERPAAAPTAAAEPDEPVEAAEPAVRESETPPARKRENLFEEFEEEGEQPDAEANLFDDEPGGSSEPDVPGREEPAEPVEPAAPSEPAESAAPAEEPREPAAAEPDPFDDARHGPAEPLRRWVDASGEHATVGTLVDVRGDAVEILKANGRTVVVPLGHLSATDRVYAAAAGARLAAGKAAAPDATDTAGL